MFSKMNKNVFFLLLCFSCKHIHAQPHKFTGGIVLNANGIEFKGNSAQFWTSSNQTTKIDGTVGLSAGLFVKREFNKTLYSSLELRYIKKGSIYEFNSQYGTQAFQTVDLKYIEIPLLFGYKYKPFKRSYYLESGFAYAKLISSNIKENDLTPRSGTPNTKEFKNNDFSWIASLKFPVVKKLKENFLFGLRVSRSILTIHKYNKIYNFDYGIELIYVFNK
jgi:hypothetical protein